MFVTRSIIYDEIFLFLLKYFYSIKNIILFLLFSIISVVNYRLRKPLNYNWGKSLLIIIFKWNIVLKFIKHIVLPFYVFLYMSPIGKNLFYCFIYVETLPIGPCHYTSIVNFLTYVFLIYFFIHVVVYS